MEIIYGSRFAREYKKLPNKIKDLAETQETIFRKDPFDPRLKTHKLNGKLNGFFSFSIDNKNRIIFEFFENKKVVHFYSVGAHDIY